MESVSDTSTGLVPNPFERVFSASENPPTVGRHAHRRATLGSARWISPPPEDPERCVPDLGTVAHGKVQSKSCRLPRYPLLRRHVQRHQALGGSRVATDVAVEDGHWHGRRQLESVTLAFARQGHFLALVFEVPHIILGHQSVAHVLPVFHQEARQTQDHVVVHPVAAVALAALDRSVGGCAVGSDTVVHKLQFAVLVNTLDLMVHQRHQPVGCAVTRPMISVFGSQVSPRLMSSLRVGMPVAGCQVGVARISGQMASPVTDSLYLSAMLPSDFSIVFQPPMVVGQRPRATSPLPTRAYSVSVGRSLTGGCPGGVLAEIFRAG